jgi:hypothetical protein
LQSKDRTKVRQPFRAFFGAGADDFTALTTDSPLFYLFFLKNTKEYSKKTDKSLVDFLSVFYGGEEGIRTLDTLMGYTRFPIVRARPTTRLLRVCSSKHAIQLSAWLL